MPATSDADRRKKAKRVAHRLEIFLGTPIPTKKKAKPLDMLIATILSQNTNDRNSHRAYIELRKRFPRWEAVANASPKSIASAIRTGGMANQKSVRIKKILAVLEHQFGCTNLNFLKTKSDEEIFEILLSLDGVGAKTASCVLLFSLGRDVFPVDTHVHRICNRLGLVRKCPTPEKTFEAMRSVVPKGKAYSFHTNLIRFGRKVCRSSTPRCDICPILDDCTFAQRHSLRTRTARTASSVDHNFMLLDNV